MNKGYTVRLAIGLAIFSLIIGLSAVIIGSFVINSGGDELEHVSAEPAMTVVIDAGHGGADGGCVSNAYRDTSAGVEPTAVQNGTQILEKDCNLQISRVLAALFRVSGYNVVMTRDSDIMLDAEGLYGSAKMRDLRARLDIAQRYPGAVFVSIHCNKFPDPDCSGLQVYYSQRDTQSGIIAHAIQDSVVRLLQPENKRVPKASTSSIFVLDRAIQPSVLVECGFLSNDREMALLSDSGYQKKLALAILLPMLTLDME